MNNYSERATSTSAKIGIVGFRGYSGAELLRILSKHAYATPVLMEHRADPEEPSLPLGIETPKRILSTAEAAKSENLSAVLLATPPEVSMQLAPSLLQAGLKVVDLSGAFRLRDAQTYSRWYKESHSCAELLADAGYGLPEFYRDQLRSCQLIANPGCFPTAANLALRPLLQAQVVDRTRGIICDAKSGASGAGRKASLRTSFCEVAENFGAYAVIEHRHVPEVLQNSGLGEREFTFTAQLLPINRGILETIHLRVQDGVTADDLVSIFQDQYSSEPFVRVYPAGKYPDLRAVNYTNFCDIGFVFDAASQRLVLIAAIDNLVKGAAGQAVQNLNLIMGWNEAEGLL